MKSRLIPYRVLSLLFLFLIGTGTILAGPMDNYIYINAEDRLAINSSPRDLSVPKLSNNELKDFGLAVGQNGTIVFSIKGLAIWIGKDSKWSSKIDFSDERHRESVTMLDRFANKVALEQIFRSVNKDLSANLADSEISAMVVDYLPRITELLAGADGYQVLEPRRRDRRGWGKPQCIVSSYYFRFDREKIVQAIQPTPVVISIPSPPLDSEDISSNERIVVRYEKHVIVLGEGDPVPKEEEQWHDHANQAISKLSKDALRQAMKEAGKDVSPSRTPEEIQAIIDKLGDLRRYTKKYAIKSSAIDGRGKDSKLVLTVYFYFNREEIKDLIQPAERSQTIKVDLGKVIGADIPTGDDSTYIAVFRDHEENVDSTVQDKKYAQETAIRIGLEKLKKLSIERAIEDKNLRAKLPDMEDDEFQRTIKNVVANYANFTGDNNWIEDPRLITRSGNTTAPEGVRLNIYFAVDLDALKKAMLAESQTAETVKLKTYVELFWNVPPVELEENFEPEFLEEMTETVIQNVEDHFSRTGYRIVDFNKIRLDLEALTLEEKTDGIDDDDAGSKAELKQLQNLKKLELSESDFNKALLSIYADLWIKVSINAIELSQDLRKVTVRLTIGAYLFERETTEEWVILASSDSHRTILFRGDLSPILEVGKLLSGTVVTELMPKIRKKLVKLAAIQEQVLTSEQTYIVAFPGTSNKVFKSIKKLIKEESEWERKKASTKKRELSYVYTGGIENFVEELEELLEDNDYEIRSASHKTGDNRVTIEFEELEVEEIFALVFPEVSNKQFKGIKRLIKELDLDRKSASRKKRELRYAYDGGIEELVEELEDLFEDSDFGEVDIEYETGDTRIVVNLMESKRQQLVISGLSAERYNYKKVLYHEAVTEQEDVTDVVYEYLAGGDDRTGRLIFEFGYTGDLAKLEASVWRILAIDGEVRNIIKRQLIP